MKIFGKCCISQKGTSLILVYTISIKPGTSLTCKASFKSPEETFSYMYIIKYFMHPAHVAKFQSADIHFINPTHTSPDFNDHAQ